MTDLEQTLKNVLDRECELRPSCQKRHDGTIVSLSPKCWACHRHDDLARQLAEAVKKVEARQ